METVEQLKQIKTKQELKNTHAYKFGGLLIPGKPKSQMNKEELRKLLIQTVTKRQQKARSKSPSRSDKSRSRSKSPRKNKALESLPNIKLTREDREEILGCLLQMQVGYALNDDPRRYAYENARLAIEAIPLDQLTYKKIRATKGIGEAIGYVILNLLEGRTVTPLEKLYATDRVKALHVVCGVMFKN